MPDPQLILQISNLSKTYSNGVQALKNLSLTIGTNMFGLLGPNGAGKSTLMRTVATLQDADSGEVSFDGLNVLREKDSVRRILGYLPQEFGIYPKMSALDMLDHLAVMKGILNRGERKEMVEGLLQQTNLWDVRKKKLGTFSGGMKQRFGIAQALLGNPKLIIVDEPTAGLDPTERNRFLNLLSSIGRNVIVILSTHIVDDVRELCPQMAIISQGEVLLEGSPAQSIDALGGKIWRKMMDDAGELADVEETHRVISTHLVAGLTEVRVYADTHPGAGFSPVDPDIEDVYFLNLSRATRN
ncbi:MAG TPA: ABC transporter ATP-binding protein [Bryobacteraceae bacterium]